MSIPFICPLGDYHKSPLVLSRAWDKSDPEDLVKVLKFYKNNQDSERKEWIIFVPGVKNPGKKRLIKIPVGGGDEIFERNAMVVFNGFCSQNNMCFVFGIGNAPVCHIWFIPRRRGRGE